MKLTTRSGIKGIKKKKKIDDKELYKNNERNRDIQD